MSVTEHLMRPGTFSVGLRPNVPGEVARKILAAIDGAGGHIVITPGRVPEGTADATRLAAALYTGKIEDRPSRGSIEGKGISAWLGNDDGTTVIETAITKSAASLTTWITDLLVNGITVGTITNTTTYSGTFLYVTYREAIDQVCLATGAEYEVKPNFTINAAAPATLFGNPTVVVTRKPEGVDGMFRGIQGGLLDQSVSASRQARKIVVVGEAGATGSATNGSLLLKDKAGAAPTLTRLVDAAAEPAANLTGLATATLSLSGVRREFNVSSTSPGVRNFVRPGNYVYVYDVDSGIHDAANQIVFRGAVITPLKVRVLSLSWPIERGMGVYLRSNAATPAYTDLSDYVEFDDGDAFWTVGSERIYQSSGSTARLGANPEIAANLKNSATLSVAAGSTTEFTTTMTDIAGASVTWTAVAGRRYLVSACGRMQTDNALQRAVVIVADGSNVEQFRLVDDALPSGVTGGATAMFFSQFQHMTATGSVTRKIRAAMAAGTSGNGDVTVSTILVQDIGST